MELNNKSRSRTKESKIKKMNTFDNVNALYEGRELTLNAFKSGIFLLKPSQRNEWKYQHLHKCLKHYQIAPAQVNIGNASENLLNKICQIIYFLYWAEEITKKVYNNIMNSIKWREANKYSL